MTTHVRLAVIIVLCVIMVAVAYGAKAESSTNFARGFERQITHNVTRKVLTNTGVWSPDGEWIVYDTRGNTQRGGFDGSTIEIVNIRTSEVREIHHSRNGANCGVATFHPKRNEVIFIQGPENPSHDWQYCSYHRHGVIATISPPRLINLDACDITYPFTPGALRGGTHVHVWDAVGDWVSSTYEDHVLASAKEHSIGDDVNLRNVAVSIPNHEVLVANDHLRNQNGKYFSVLVT